MEAMNDRTTVFRHLRHVLRKGLTLSALCWAGHACSVAANTLPEQLIDATQLFLEDAVTDYLQRSAIVARHEVEVNRLDPRLRLASCPEPLATRLESPAQPVGRVTVRVSCPGATPWTVFVPARVKLYRDVVVVTRPLTRQGEVTLADVALVERDVGLLSQGYLSSLDQVIGTKVTRNVLPDQVLTPQHLELAEVVRKGDQVVISARATSINVRMPGEALADGAPGQQIRVKNLSSGRVVRARVLGPGQVEVAM